MKNFTAQTGVHARLTAFAGVERLDTDRRTVLFRVAQEALTNVFRHSGARKCWVAVASKDNQMLVSVRDNGKGVSEGILQFRPECLGIGIAGIRQRVKECDGNLRITNAETGGTLIEVAIPINRELAEAAPSTFRSTGAP